jgi:hypothetical protein
MVSDVRLTLNRRIEVRSAARPNVGETRTDFVVLRDAVTACRRRRAEHAVPAALIGQSNQLRGSLPRPARRYRRNRQ